MKRILVTGSRNWPDQQAVWDALDQATDGIDRDSLIIVHGDCPTGADIHASRWAVARNVVHEAHIANWRLSGRAAGPLRNQHMVDAGADLCLAFPLGESRGTRGCMALAKAAGIPVKEYTP